MTECWNWKRGQNGDGYGRLTKAGETVYVHRAVWEVVYGVIPPGMCVCHKCDNRICMNPDHLFLGTKAENNADMVRKGRLVVPRGEKSGQHKLTDDQVREIRRLSGTWEQKKISKRFGVTQGTVSAIVRRFTWNHI